MDEFEQYEPAIYTATCETAGCGNANIPIGGLLAHPTEPFFLCGVCGKRITNYHLE